MGIGKTPPSHVGKNSQIIPYNFFEGFPMGDFFRGQYREAEIATASPRLRPLGEKTTFNSKTFPGAIIFNLPRLIRQDCDHSVKQHSTKTHFLPFLKFDCDHSVKIKHSSQKHFFPMIFNWQVVLIVTTLLFLGFHAPRVKIVI